MVSFLPSLLSPTLRQISLSFSMDYSFYPLSHVSNSLPLQVSDETLLRSLRPGSAFLFLVPVVYSASEERFHVFALKAGPMLRC